MRTKLTALALAGTLGLAGLTGAVVLAPAVSYAATGDTPLSDRVSAIRDALAGLVSDGSISQTQADEVATTLAEQLPAHRHGPRRGAPLDLSAAAEVLGMTQQELREAHRAGKSLADLAREKGVDSATLVDALAEAARSRLAEAVSDGRLTQEQADHRSADLEARIAERLDDVRGPGGHGHGGPRGEMRPSSAQDPQA